MKKIVIVLVILILAISAGAFYINGVFLPKKIKALIVEGLEEATGKKAILGSVSFNIFKGLVLRDLIIYDGNVAVLNSKEVSAVVLIWPVFKRQIIVPALMINSPDLFVERRPDGSVNILDPFYRKTPPRLKHDFSIVVSRINVRGAHVNFVDSLVDPAFAKEVDKLNLDIFLALPADIKLNLKFELPQTLPAGIAATGEYNILAKDFSARIACKELSLKEFERYFTSLAVPSGRIDCLAKVRYKENILSAEIDAQSKELLFVKDKLEVSIDSVVKANIRYNSAEKALNYFGTLDIHSMDIAGVEYVNRIDEVKGKVVFSDANISSDTLDAGVLGLAVKAKINIAELKSPDPTINIDITSEPDLVALQTILKDNLKLNVPAELQGDGKLSISMGYKIRSGQVLDITGSLDMLNAAIIMAQDRPPVEDVNGTFAFSANQLTWADLNFRYRDVDYKTSGTLTNFQAPGVQLKMQSKDFELDSIFAVGDRVFSFSKFSGRYKDLEFSISGDVGLKEPSKTDCDIEGELNIKLEGLKEILKGSGAKLDKVKPGGGLYAAFGLKGDIRDIKSCAINAKLSSDLISLYDLKLSDFKADYSQKDGIANMLFMQSTLYGGTMDATGRMELSSKDLPYSANVDIKGVKLEKLKADTAFKDKDVSGTINANARLKGASGDLSRLEGFGRITIASGKLWQLNLFQGLGGLLFSRDFSNIVFSGGACDFLIGDRAISTDDLDLKSDVINMHGSMKIGFDNSIDATLKALVLQEAIEAGPTVRKLTKAIGRYGFIKVTGTLKEPKYSLQPDVADIVEDLASSIFRR